MFQQVVRLLFKHHNWPPISSIVRHCCNLLSLPQTHVKKIGIRMASLRGQVYHKILLSILANSLCLIVNDVNIEEYFIVHVKSTGTIECLRNSARVQRCTICTSRSIPTFGKFYKLLHFVHQWLHTSKFHYPIVPWFKLRKINTKRYKRI